MGVVVQRNAPANLPLGKTRYQLYRKLAGPQGRSGRVRKISPHGIRSPDRPARSQSLYRLSYPGPLYCIVKNICAVSGKMQSFVTSQQVVRGLTTGFEMLKILTTNFGDTFLQLSVRCVPQEMCNAEGDVPKHEDLRPCHERIK